jgi:hypothetical protein
MNVSTEKIVTSIKLNFLGAFFRIFKKSKNEDPFFE